MLLRSVMLAGERAGLRAVIARIAGGNDTSVRLHEREGFFTVGTMEEVGFKFGRPIDVVVMQRTFRDGAKGDAE